MAHNAIQDTLQENEAMLKKHMAACLVVTAFAAAPAFAQTSPAAPSGGTDRPTASGSGTATSGSSAMQPSGAAGTSTMQPGGAAGASTMTQSNMGQSGAMQGQFMTQMQPNQIMASKLIGTRVVSSNNESIGDINDVIVDRNGQAVAAVVGVGGFLGIGEKDVAVPFNSLEFASGQQANAGAGNNANAPATTGSTAGAGTTGGAGTMGTTSGSGTAGAGSTAGGGTMGSGNANTAGNLGSDGPDRVILRMTKAELQGAPAFNTSGGNNANSTGNSGGQSGTTAAPKP
jgi:sporulation protein YlmC with PRC-barrel domain